ncbi:MAG: hypothetical protein ACR2NM_16725 [Bythopirellula sp.]
MARVLRRIQELARVAFPSITRSVIGALSLSVALGWSAGTLAHEEAIEQVDPPDFSYDAADQSVRSEVWDNPLSYDADVLAQDKLVWYAWLEFIPDEGDVIWLGCKADSAWVDRQRLPLPPAEYAAPTLSMGRSGQLWLTYEARVDDQWDLFAVPLDGCQAEGEHRRVSSSPGSDILHKSCGADRAGIWIVWQSDNDGQFEILARFATPDRLGPIQRISSNPWGDWHPAVAVTVDDRVCVAWDAYDGSSYNVLCRHFDSGQWSDPIPIATTPRFEGRVDLATDASGQVYVAWEEGGEHWGGPFRGINSELIRDAVGPLHRHRELHIAAIDRAGERFDLADPLPMPSTNLARQRANRPPGVEKLGAFYERARLTVDAAGRLWIFYRHYYTPWLGIAHRTHVQQGWGIYARYYDQHGWSQLLKCSIGQGDGMQRLEATPTSNGILAAWTTGRTDRQTSAQPRGVATAALPLDQSEPVRLPLRKSTAVPPAAQRREKRAASRVRATVAGTDYYLLFGDLHRHTDLSLCRVPMDGTLDDAYRYATDVAQLDFLGITDHSRDIALGDPLSQLWWRSRKEVYRRQLAVGDEMWFTPFFSYERSHSNTADHNVISLHGEMLRPHTYPVPQFWQELDENTLTIPHQPIRRDTWNYQDDVLRPLVEIFQGCRDESIEEHVHEGLSKGYHLGFIASSDHVSTSASYAGVWAEASSRESVFRSLQARRTFAATAKIELQVMADGQHWMGEIIPAREQPLELSLNARGTAPIRLVELIVDGSVEKTFTPRDVSVNISESINPLGKRYAYFHLLQRDGNEAWSSPIWFGGAEQPEPSLSR